tara:strand:- start:1490 stop:1660 length:171 start_codon:yes stop_codon:yes gene_type:complete
MAKVTVVKEYEQRRDEIKLEVHNQYKLKNKWCALKPTECTCKSSNNNCLENGKINR